MQSPFKFLDSFTKEDRDIFFGRERETEELYHKVFENKILLVYGVSGTGKSSLIHCGLADKFSESDWLPVNVRRGGNIMESLAIALSSVSITPINPNISKKGWLAKTIRSLYLDHFKPLFLIFDQFEELFIFGNKPEKEEFINAVREITESDLQCRFLFVIREEYLAGITEFEKQIPSILANRVRIEKMTRTNAQQAIEGPCKFSGIDVEPGFSELLLDKLSPGGGEIELTYLQVFLDKIFKLAVSEKPESIPQFNLSLLQNTGDVKDLLGSFLEEQIAQLPDPDTALVVLKAFVSTKGTKRQVTEEEVLDYSRTLGKNISPEPLRDLIQKFVALRILRDKDDSGRYELRHDALAAKIFEKITIFEKDLLEIRQFIENAFANYEKRKILMSVADLKYIGQYEDKLFLGGALLEFINLCKDDIRKKQKVLNLITGVCVTVMIAVIYITIIYFYNESDSKDAKNNTISALLNEDNPIDGFLLANKTNKKFPSGLTEAAMIKSFYLIADNFKKQQKLNPFKSFFDFSPCKANILFADFSYDGLYIYGYTTDSMIYIWDNNGKVKSAVSLKEIPVDLKISADSKYIAAVFPSKTSAVWNINGDSLFNFQVCYDSHNVKDVISFAPGKKMIAGISPDSKVNIYSLESGQVIQKIANHTGDVTSVCFSPDERFIATSSKDKTARIMYYNKNKQLFDEYSVIKNHKDIVWSIGFNSTSDYVVTASADSSVKMFTLTGENHEMFDSPDDWLLNHWSPVCHAEFTKSKLFITLTRYKTTDSTINSEFFTWQTASYFGFLIKVLEADTILTQIDFSPNPKYLHQAYSRFDDTITKFSTTLPDVNINIMVFPGVQPRFSPDGNYLLTLSGKKINLYPVNINEIEKLVFENKIFGEIKME